ncbi:hypothetical protein [Plantactinospora sp. B5E13]|uniref:hypothetical protein n=1 Tax=unclassified Plantactinospora TaxID=2631981 RepID=UPI00325E6AEE
MTYDLFFAARRAEQPQGEPLDTAGEVNSDDPPGREVWLRLVAADTLPLRSRHEAAAFTQPTVDRLAAHSSDLVPSLRTAPVVPCGVE